MEYCNVHTHVVSASNVRAIVNQYPDEFTAHDMFSIGIHPWRINNEKTGGWLRMIKEIAKDHRCVAIGECGLDKRIELSLEEQIPVFESQLLLAQDLNKPVIIHCVAAYDEVIAISKALRITVPMIIHGFSKNMQLATRLLKEGFYLSLGKYLLRNPELSKVLREIPDDRFFLETDSLAESIAEVYEVAANAKSIDVGTLSKIVSKNFNTVFGFNN